MKSPLDGVMLKPDIIHLTGIYVHESLLDSAIMFECILYDGMITKTLTLEYCKQKQWLVLVMQNIKKVSLTILCYCFLVVCLLTYYRGRCLVPI